MMEGAETDTDRQALTVDIRAFMDCFFPPTLVAQWDLSFELLTEPSSLKNKRKTTQTYLNLKHKELLQFVIFFKFPLLHFCFACQAK